MKQVIFFCIVAVLLLPRITTAFPCRGTLQAEKKSRNKDLTQSERDAFNEFILPAFRTIQADGSLPWGSSEMQNRAHLVSAYASYLNSYATHRLRASELNILSEVIAATQRTVELHLAGDEISLKANDIQIEVPPGWFPPEYGPYDPPAPKNLSLMDQIQRSAFRARGWHWVGSAEFSDDMQITAKTSKSPIQALYGDNTGRELFWMKKSVSGNLEPLLDRIRIAENYVYVDNVLTGYRIPRSLEVFARDKNGKWQPYFFEWFLGSWRPATQFMGKPVKVACMSCHLDTRGELNPLPKQLRVESDFREIGIDNRNLIERLLREFNASQ